MQSLTRFQIAQLRQGKLILATESMAVFMACFFSAVFLPQLLVRYLYADQPLLEEPALLQYIPVVVFVIGMAFFLFAVVANIMSWMKIRTLETQLAVEEAECCMNGHCGDCGCCETDTEMAEMEKMAEMAMAASKPVKSTRGRKPTRK